MKFTSGALKGLQLLYRFAGGQVRTDQVELDAPVQLVHDVSRGAEIQAGAGLHQGYINVSLTNTHAVAAGVVRSEQSFDPGATIWATLGVNPAQYQFWLMEATVRMHQDLAFVTGQLIIDQDTVPGSIEDHRVLTHFWNLELSTNMIAGTNLNAAVNSLGDPRQVALPRLIPDLAEVVFTTDASGAVQAIVAQLLFWCGPRGTLPPGLA